MCRRLDIMDIKNIDPVEPKTAQTVVKRPHDAVPTIIPAYPPCGRLYVDATVLLARRAGFQNPPHLGRQDELIARPTGERFTETLFRKTMTVERRRVEIANAGIPCGRQRCRHILLVERRVHVADRGRTEAEAREVERHIVARREAACGKGRSLKHC